MRSLTANLQPVLVFFVFVLLWAIMPGTHLVMDEGYRLLQAQSLHESVSFPVVLHYPGLEILGSLADEVRPLPAHYGHLSEHGLICIYNPAIALLSSGFTGKGVLLIPVFSGFLLWLFIYKRLLKAGFSAVNAGLIPLAGTPMLFFSMRFWSYPLCILLVFLAVTAAKRQNPVTAYCLVALSALFRTEYSVAFILVFLYLDNSWYKRAFQAIPAIILILAGTWLLSGGDLLSNHLISGTSEQVLYGHSEDSLMIQKLHAWGKTLFALVPGYGSPGWWIPGLVLWILWFFAIKGANTAIPGLVICLAVCILSAMGKYSFLDGFSMKHPLLVFPYLWLLSVETLRRSWRELIVFALLFVLLLPMHTEGPDWGVRHVFLPMFLILGNLEPSRKNTFPILAFGLLIAVSSLLFLGINRNRVQNLNDVAESHGGSVIATNWIIPGWMTDTMQKEIPVVYAATSNQLAESLEKLNEYDPVVICLQRDALLTAALLRETLYEFKVCGEVGFGHSLNCVLLNRQE